MSHPPEHLIDRAVSLLRAGKLVAFPTEIVYGLGADARNPAAVRRIFTAKGRPSTNPLIVHVPDVAVAKRYTTRWTRAADLLTAKFWPGPLTLVLPKTAEIPDIVTAGRPTVGLRAPDHVLALDLLRAFDGPLAGPSANRSNHVSPTTALHVGEELGGSIDLILDGGACSVGIESTVIDLSNDVPRILRPGGVTREEIESVVGRVDVLANVVTDVTRPAEAPGQHAVHYAPRTRAYRFESSDRQLLDVAGRAMIQIGLVSEPTKHDSRVTMPRDPIVYARHLYEVLRELDAMQLTEMLIEMPPDVSEWAAVRDRLIRATRPLSDRRA